MATQRTDMSWKETLAPFVIPSWGRGIVAVATSLLPYLALCVAIYLCLSVSPWISIALMFPAAGFAVRTFICFHDCTHGSLLPSRRANAMVGSVLGLVLLSPFARWRHDHVMHHSSSGDLDRRGHGDVEMMTVEEFHAAPVKKQLAYRAFRNPLIMFGIGPLMAMIIGPRMWNEDMRPRLRNSIILLDIALTFVIGLLVWAMGPVDFLIAWLPAALMAGAAGIFLFFVQHQFEEVYFERNTDWSYFDAALMGSSFFDLPLVLRFFTGNIGYHHVHHLNARIPHYNLPDAHKASPRFAEVPTLTLLEAARCTRFKLYDERTGRMVTFAEARQSFAGATALS
jgi:omega-6 fatty acid desaturase (delta-12 desaturase)